MVRKPIAFLKKRVVGSHVYMLVSVIEQSANLCGM